MRVSGSPVSRPCSRHHAMAADRALRRTLNVAGALVAQVAVNQAATWRQSAYKIVLPRSSRARWGVARMDRTVAVTTRAASAVFRRLVRFSSAAPCST